MVKKILIVLSVLAVAVLTIHLIINYRHNAIYRNPAFAHGNGRLEATEIYISTKLAGRIEAIYVNDGDFVKKGQLLALMQTDILSAELDQAKARKIQAESALDAANAAINLRRSEADAAAASVQLKESSYNGAKKRFERASELLRDSAISRQNFEDDQTNYQNCAADLTAAQASLKKAQAAITAAQADADGCRANIKAAQADITRIQSDLDDCRLISPIDGRIQFRTAQAGEVLAAGGRVLNLVDLSDVYITFFLPEKDAGRTAIGAETRIILDAAPNMPIPAKIFFVSDVAQFTPKTVETGIERQKLMFRVKARIPPELLQKHLQLVKTGLPGIAWVKLDPHVQWPDFLRLRSER